MIPDKAQELPMFENTQITEIGEWQEMAKAYLCKFADGTTRHVPKEVLEGFIGDEGGVATTAGETGQVPIGGVDGGADLGTGTGTAPTGDEPVNPTQPDSAPVNSEKIDAGSADEIEHIVTEDDLTNNPSLVDAGVKVGDTIMIPKTEEKTGEEEA